MSGHIFEKDDLFVLLPFNSLAEQSETHEHPNGNWSDELIHSLENLSGNNSFCENTDLHTSKNSIFLETISESEENQNNKDEKKTETNLEKLLDEFQITNDFLLNKDNPFFSLSFENTPDEILGISNHEIGAKLSESNSNRKNLYNTTNITNTNRNKNSLHIVSNKENKYTKQKNTKEKINHLNKKPITQKKPNKQKKQTKTKKSQNNSTIIRRISPRNSFKTTNPTLLRETEQNSKGVKGKRNLRKRNYKDEQKKRNPIRKEVVDCGKEMYKLLTSELGAMTGGPSQRELTKYTNFFAKKIGEMLGANDQEIPLFKSQTKYLLSNSRRTLTEYISELIVGLLAINFYNCEKKIPESSKRLYRLLTNLSKKKFFKKDKNISQTENQNQNQKQKQKQNQKLNQKQIQKQNQQNLFFLFGFQNNINNIEVNYDKI
ncbi:hypothetical protein M0812_21463 [Anaeramoeba flamelloides]|uniref:Uncharacterized protein n=1 Tax=Anaeramoeba flamelloides TaxID=1746091 RepID=A0AAV7YRZ5_9EUKA|nr:hypothetical protein M0812_21463 [Anaeramoeba flamelloides]